MDIDQQTRFAQYIREALELPSEARLEYLFSRSDGDWGMFEDALVNLRSRGLLPSENPSSLHEPDYGDAAATDASLHSGISPRYKLLKVIGEGGMAIVYLADDMGPVRRRVALKVIKLGVVSANVLSRFRAERQVLAMMSHPGIAQIYDSGEAPDGRLYYAMEYVPGLPITKFCDRGTLSLDGRIDLFLRVCEAVQHAHEKGIIHRDLKPSNIVVRDSVEGVQPNVIDFGVAKATDQKQFVRTIATQHGEIIGSAQYMSPEQADGRFLEVDTRTDIYSLGVILHQLLVGVLPIHIDQGASYSLSARKIMTEVPVPPHRRLVEALNWRPEIAELRRTSFKALRSRLSGDLDHIIMKSLSKEPSNRYMSVSEFADDLRRFQRSEPVIAGTLPITKRIMKFVRRHKVWMVSTLVPVIGILATLFINAGLYVKYTTAEEIAEIQLSEILRLSDITRLHNLRQEVEQLAPPHPELIADMEGWIQRAKQLVGRLQDHETELTQLESMVESEADLTMEERFRFESLSELVTELRPFADADPHVGALAGIEERLAFARTVGQRSIHDYAAEWEKATAAIANDNLSPAYERLVIVPQMGIVPLGPDPISGLWEFAHLRSGEPPSRGADGQLVISEETGIVLVLVPGGTLEMGATGERDPDNPFRDTHSTWVEEDELPVQTIPLDPFFISKYEVTQAQWIRFTGHASSTHTPGTKRHISRLQPVDTVSWFEADRVSRSLGLALPTEAQWEFAARGGTKTTWWTGNRRASLKTKENLHDLTSHRSGTPQAWEKEVWEDGYAATAPVSSLEPNPFGLFHVHGNIREWVADTYGSYNHRTRPGDGLRMVSGTGTDKIVRGTGWAGLAHLGRSAARWPMQPAMRNAAGIRPSMAVDQSSGEQ